MAATREVIPSPLCPLSGRKVDLYQTPSGCFFRSPGWWKTGLFPSKAGALSWLTEIKAREAFIAGAEVIKISVLSAGHQVPAYMVRSPLGWTSDHPSDDRHGLAFDVLGQGEPPVEIVRVDTETKYAGPAEGFDDNKPVGVDEVISMGRDLKASHKKKR